MNAIRYAIGYARVSSEEQKKEGYSIPSQIKTIQRYAVEKGFRLLRIYEEVESAKQAGRQAFEELFQLLKSYKQDCPALLVEKTDRLTRNWADKALIEALIDSHDLEIHLIKENNILGRSAAPTAFAMADMSAMFARFTIKNLQAETKKGQLEKAERGIYPSRAVFGYQNVVRDGEKVVEAHAHMGPLVSQIFAWYATGNSGTGELALKATKLGRGLPGMPKLLHRSQVHRLLRNSFYTGVFVWKGHTYPGRHAPLVTPKVFDRVQRLMDKFGHGQPRVRKHSWLFQGLIRCELCGCLLVGERRTKKLVSGRTLGWTYYHCSFSKGHHKVRYVREEALNAQFIQEFAKLQLESDTFEILVRTLKFGQAEEEQIYQRRLDGLEAHARQLDTRIHNSFELVADGHVGASRFKKQIAGWEVEQKAVQSEIDQLRSQNRSRLDDCVTILELAQRAVILYESMDQEQKREMIRFLTSNLLWKEGELIVEFRKPFAALASWKDDAEKNRAVNLENDGPVLNGSGGRI